MLHISGSYTCFWSLILSSCTCRYIYNHGGAEHILLDYGSLSGWTGKAICRTADKRRTESTSGYERQNEHAQIWGRHLGNTTPDITCPLVSATLHNGIHGDRWLPHPTGNPGSFNSNTMERIYFQTPCLKIHAKLMCYSKNVFLGCHNMHRFLKCSNTHDTIYIQKP